MFHCPKFQKVESIMGRVPKISVSQYWFLCYNYPLKGTSRSLLNQREEPWKAEDFYHPQKLNICHSRSQWTFIFGKPLVPGSMQGRAVLAVRQQAWGFCACLWASYIILSVWKEDYFSSLTNNLLIGLAFQLIITQHCTISKFVTLFFTILCTTRGISMLDFV